MKKRKLIKKEYHAKDRLSELPQSVIFDILRLLPLTDVVRTMVLSKHWKNLWIAIPWLDFNICMMKNKDKFREFVYGALSCWRGSKILRFGVRTHYVDQKSLRNDDIDRWVHFAMEKDVEDLELYLTYLVAQDLYSCSSLKQLCLVNCNVQIYGNVHWDQLKSLRICGGCIGEKAMNKVLCGSPRLESLTLILTDNTVENLSIHSSSLKRLTVYSRLLDRELRICTPNLEYLRILGHAYSKYLLMNSMPSLSEAILEMVSPHYFVEEVLTQILPVIDHVERVYLSDPCVEAVGAMKEKHIISSFPNANSLEIRACRERCEKIVDILQMFPQLRHLLLHISYGSQQSSFNFDRNLPNSFLLKLRTIEVTCSKGDGSIIPLIQILLKYASNLEKLLFLEDRSCPRKILLKMQRSSPDEELIFDHTKLCLQ